MSLFVFIFSRCPTTDAPPAGRENCPRSVKFLADEAQQAARLFAAQQRRAGAHMNVAQGLPSSDDDKGEAEDKTEDEAEAEAEDEAEDKGQDEEDKGKDEDKRRDGDEDEEGQDEDSQHHLAACSRFLT